ncbi:MAG: hypothetical protein H6713_08445 [Myxococcales bacterium]|nr:hypothetical protein [Myxococcales bacterium]MCB9750017.1 hypothetical protein [Myxococcales bacterium]
MLLEQVSHARAEPPSADDGAFVLDEVLGLYLVAEHRRREPKAALAAMRAVEEVYAGFCVWNRGHDAMTTHTEELRRYFVRALDRALELVEPYTPDIALAQFSLDRVVLASAGDAAALLLRGAGYRWLLAGARDSCSLYLEPDDVIVLMSSRVATAPHILRELVALSVGGAAPDELVSRASLADETTMAVIRSRRALPAATRRATITADVFAPAARSRT